MLHHGIHGKDVLHRQLPPHLHSSGNGRQLQLVSASFQMSKSIGPGQLVSIEETQRYAGLKRSIESLILTKRGTSLDGDVK